MESSASVTVLEFDTEITGKTGGVKGAATPEDRARIEVLLNRMVDAAKAQKGSLKDRWDVNESFYNCEDYDRSFKPCKNAAAFNIPIQRSKLDTLNSTVVTPIITASPYFTAKSAGRGALNTDEAEKVLDWALDLAQFPQKLKEGATVTGNTGQVFLRAWFDATAKGFHAYEPDSQSKEMDGEVSFAAVRIDVIHPRDFIAYPVTVPVHRSRLCGHRVLLRRQEISELRKAKRWYNDQPCLTETLDASAPGKSTDFAKVEPNVQSEQEDQPIEIWFLLVKLDLNKDGTEEWYQVVYNQDSREVLDITSYKWARPEYFRLSYDTELGSIFNSSSPAQIIQGPCKAYNELFNIYYDGAAISAFPTTFFDRNSGYTEDQFLDMEIGQAIPVDGIPNIQQISVSFNGREIPYLLQLLDDKIDQALRMPKTAGGQQLEKGSTATEAAQLGEALSLSQNSYLLAFASGLCDLADHVLTMIAANAGVIMETYGDSFPCDDPEKLNVKCLWEVTGKSPMASGQYVTSKTMEVVAALGQLGLGDMVDTRAIAESLIQYSGLPNGLKILRTDEEMAMIQQQQEQALYEQAAIDGVPPQPGMEGGGGGIPQGFGPVAGGIGGPF